MNDLKGKDTTMEKYFFKRIKEGHHTFEAGNAMKESGLQWAEIKLYSQQLGCYYLMACLYLFPGPLFSGAIHGCVLSFK